MTAEDADRVLLVEDDPSDAALIETLLHDGGKKRPIVHVSCLKDAVSALREDRFEAVLLDLRLPDGTGVECVDAVRSAASDVPIVVLTGLDDEALALRCLSGGAQDYLSKNEVQAQSLVRAVNYACARVRERSERRRADVLQQRLASIVEASADGILSVSIDGDVISWNRGAELILGIGASEVVGRPLAQVVRETDHGALSWRDLLRLNDTPGRDAAFESTWLRKDGDAVSVSVVTCALPGTNGGRGTAAIFRDVTDARRRDRELRERNAQLMQRERQMRALTARLNAAREEERTRISREVHDELGQLLTGLKMDLRWAVRRLETASEGSVATAIERLAEAEGLLDQTVETVQRIAVELRPSALDSLGLPAAVRDEALRFQARSGIETLVTLDTHRTPPLEAATALFRIFQELLTNVARHALASSVQVRLSRTQKQFRLEVEDDGIGIPAGDAASASLGVLGMQERAAALGGTVTLSRRATSGTLARVTLPDRSES